MTVRDQHKGCHGTKRAGRERSHHARIDAPPISRLDTPTHIRRPPMLQPGLHTEIETYAGYIEVQLLSLIHI